MNLTRRQFLFASLALPGCFGRAPKVDTGLLPEVKPSSRLDTALDQGVRYLLSKQVADGAWRSERYATFRDGPALTPLVLNALQTAPESKESKAACHKAADCLAKMVKADGSIDPGKFGLSYPAYIAALTVLALSQPGFEEHRKARDAWLAYLRERQLTEDLGWEPPNKEYGGWGYCSGIPKKPKAGEFSPPFVESNLSATLYALDALRAAGVPADDPALQKALVFVQRCQNWTDLALVAEPFLDGGFFFIYDDPVRNKAGVAGKREDGSLRFHSYGSTTADGLRALHLCGLAKDHARVQAARKWLVDNFRADTTPGTFQKERESNRDAIYYYYAASVAQAFGGLGTKVLDRNFVWAESLADALIKRQQPDGSWANPNGAFREDEILTATPLAIIALAHCGKSLAG